MNDNNTQKKSVLICEDEGLVSFDLSKTLESFGLDVVGIARTAEESIQIAKERRPDLALMDICIAGEKDGIDTAIILKEELGIPSIYLSAYSDDETLSKAVKASPLGYLTKPVQKESLRTTILSGIHASQSAPNLAESVEVSKEEGVQVLSRLIRSRRLLGTAKYILSGMAYHLNNYLQVVLGNLNWLQQCNTLQDYEKRYVFKALAACKQSRRFIRKMLWCAGTGVYEFKFENLNYLIRESVDEARPLLFHKKISFDSSISENARCLVNRDAFKAALKEIIRNADEASSEDGSIKIIASSYFNHRSDTGEPEGNYFLIEVQDEGQGFSEENLSMAFVPFYSTKETHDFGRGIGLSIAKGILEAHQGRLLIASGNQGTQVRCYLPVNH